MTRLAAGTAVAILVALTASACGAADNGGSIQTPPSSATTSIPGATTTSTSGSGSTLPGGD